MVHFIYHSNYILARIHNTIMYSFLDPMNIFVHGVVVDQSPPPPPRAAK